METPTFLYRLEIWSLGPGLEKKMVYASKWGMQEVAETFDVATASLSSNFRVSIDRKRILTPTL